MSWWASSGNRNLGMGVVEIVTGLLAGSHRCSKADALDFLPVVAGWPQLRPCSGRRQGAAAGMRLAPPMPRPHGTGRGISAPIGGTALGFGGRDPYVLEDSIMRDVLETLAAPFFALLDFALAAPAAAALATASIVGVAVVMLVA